MNYAKIKGKCVVKDGYFKYIVNVNPISCQCNKYSKNAKYSKYCDHILLILKNEYKLDDFCINYMHIIDCFNITNTNSDEMKTLIINKFNSYECGICLSPIIVKSDVKSDVEYIHNNYYECNKML